MGKTNPKLIARKRRRMRIRKHLSGTADRPRLAVFRSAKHIYVQVIDDGIGSTLVAASSLSPEIRQMKSELSGKKAIATEVGKLVAKKAVEKGIKQVAFDRGGYLYHGRVRALAEGAREAGLEF